MVDRLSRDISERLKSRKNIHIALFICVIVITGSIVYFSSVGISYHDVDTNNRWLGPKFEAESFVLNGAKIVYDANASGKKSVLIDGEDTILKTIYLYSGEYNLIIRAKSELIVSTMECFVDEESLGKVELRGEYQYYSFKVNVNDGKNDFKIANEDFGKIFLDYISIEKAAKNGLYEPSSIIRRLHESNGKGKIESQENTISETFALTKNGDYVEFHPVFASNGNYELSFQGKVENGTNAEISFSLNDAKVSDIILDGSESAFYSCDFFISEGVHNIKLKLKDVENSNESAHVLISFISVKIRQPYRSYIGELHAHTSYSDGKGLPAEAYSYAKNVAKLDFFAITDHTSLLTDEEYQKTIKEAEFASTSYFTALYGQEYGFYFGLREYNIIGVNELCNVPFWDCANFYNWAEEKNAFVGLNHPIYGKYGLMLEKSFEKSSEKVCTFEILNGYHGEPFETAYFDALNLGFKVAPVSGQDNHERDWGMKKTNGRYYLTGLVAQTLDQENLIDAIHNRRTYAFTTSEQKNRTNLFIAANGHLLGDAFKNEGKVSISICLYSHGNEADSFKKIVLYRDGKVLQELNHGSQIVHYTFEDNPEPGTHYYFIKAEQYDGDLLWSSCIWLY